MMTDSHLQINEEKKPTPSPTNNSTVFVIALILNLVFLAIFAMFITSTNCNSGNLQTSEENVNPGKVPNDNSFVLADEPIANQQLVMNDAENFYSDSTMDNAVMDDAGSFTSTEQKDECGNPTLNIGLESGAVVEGSWPWIVAINQGCSGILVTHAHVITAAHCMLKNMKYYVTYGSVDKAEHRKQRVSMVRLHPKYSNLTQYFDLALLTLERPIKDNMMPICLPTGPLQRGVNDGSVWVAGWGIQQKMDVYSTLLLKEAILTIVDCGNMYIQKIGIMKSTAMCAAQVGQDICKGDSGGPMISRLNNEWQVHGVVSWGLGCNQEHPEVYTSLYALRSWYCCFLSFLENCQGVICKDGTSSPTVSAVPQSSTPNEEDGTYIISNSDEDNNTTVVNTAAFVGFQNEFNICKYTLAVLGGWNGDGTPTADIQAYTDLYNTMKEAHMAELKPLIIEEQTPEQSDQDNINFYESINFSNSNGSFNASAPNKTISQYAHIFEVITGTGNQHATASQYFEEHAPSSELISHYDIDSFYGGPANFDYYSDYGEGNITTQMSELKPCACGFMSQQYFDFLKKDHPDMYLVYKNEREKDKIGMDLQNPNHCQSNTS